MALPVSAMDFAAPEPPKSAAEFLPKEADSFGEGLWNLLRAASAVVTPCFHEALGVCVRVFGAVLLVGLVGQLAPQVSAQALQLTGTAAVAALLLEPSASLLELGVETARELQDYGKLLLPVLAGAMAARGGVTSGTALYVGTAVFDGLLSWAATKVMVPMVWCHLAFAVGHSAVGEPLLARFRDGIAKVMEWVLKGTLYVFTTYMAVTGVVSGAADATAAKAAKLAISAGIPVVGGILSDAADAVLLSAQTMASGAGIWGILTILAIVCGPAVQLLSQYLLLKVTAALCMAVGDEGTLVGDFATALGMLLALVGTQCVLLLISGLCFLQGVGG